MTQVKFLTDEWFQRVEQLAAESGDLRVPPPLKALIWNMVVEMPDGSEKNVSMRHMVFHPGHADGAALTMYMEESLARKLFIDGDTQAGLMAFMSGEMRVEGRVEMITILQNEQPSPEMMALGERIKAITLP